MLSMLLMDINRIPPFSSLIGVSQTKLRPTSWRVYVSKFGKGAMHAPPANLSEREGHTMNMLLAGLAAVGLCVRPVSAKQPSARTDFSGRWVLNTAQTKDVPVGLRDYNMVVSQDALQLEVRTNLKGKLTPRIRQLSQLPPQEEVQALPGGLLPNGERQTNVVDTPAYGWPNASLQGVSGDTSEDGPPWQLAPLTLIPGIGSPGCTQAPRTGPFAAFILYPPRAVYRFDRRKSSAEFGSSRHAPATSEARWGKGGKVLKLWLAGRDTLSSMCGMWHWTVLQERWKLSKDGQTLLVDRTVSTLMGPRRFRLIFSKQSATRVEP